MVKNPLASAGDSSSIHGLGRSPEEENGKSTPVILPGRSHGQRSLVGYRPWGCKELYMTELVNSNNNIYLTGLL